MSQPVVLITDNINEKAVAILENHCTVRYKKKLSAEELLKEIEDVDALMIRSASTVTPEVLKKAKKLKIVGRAGVGTDNINLPAATQKGVIVVNSPEGNTIAASEHTVGMLMALARHIPEGDATMKAGEWARSKLVGVEVFGKTLGVIGMGKIGFRVASTAKTLGMKINVFDPFLSKAKAEELDVNLVDLDSIWADSDFITIHAPKTKETANLVNSETIAKCKDNVRFVNCARGGIINESDLAAAIELGKVAGAALDVFDGEPPSPDNPLLKLEGKVVLTPHLGASTEEAQINVALDVAEQIRDFFAEGYATNAVNMPVLRKDVLDPVKDYMQMAEVLGSMARQLSKGAVQSVEIIAKGTLQQHRIAPLTLAVLKGLFSKTQEGVNYVNAPNIAEERGIEVKESSTKSAKNFINLLEVLLETDTGMTQVSGTLISDTIFRIVEINNYPVTLEPTDHILLTPHKDQPGMIAKVATILSEDSVNISALQVGRERSATTMVGGTSIMIFNMDNSPSEDALVRIKAEAGIFDTMLVQL